MAVAGWAVEGGFVRFCTTFGLLACFTATALAWVVAEVVMVKAFVEVRRTSMVMTHIAFVLWLIQEADDVLWRFHVSLKRNAIWIACGHHFQLVVGCQVQIACEGIWRIGWAHSDYFQDSYSNAFPLHHRLYASGLLLDKWLLQGKGCLLNF